MFSLEIALPSSVVSIEHGLLLRTLKIYQIIRYASIFGTEKIIIYYDSFIPRTIDKKVKALIRKIHNYLITPPYLRKKLMPLDKDLKFVGALPPLRLNIYDVSMKPRPNEIRVCLIRRRNDKFTADCGLKEEVLIIDNESNIREGLGIVRIIDTHRMIGKYIDKDNCNIYLGPSIAFEYSLKNIIEKEQGTNTCIIATSKYGVVPKAEDIRRVLFNKSRLLVLFGSPYGGLYEIAENEGWKLEDRIKYIWNTIPGQHVKTIRTEEALIITLGLINLLIRK